MSLKPDEFKFLCELLRKRSGLAIGEDKLYLVESRLPPIAKAHGIASLSDLVTTLRLRPTEALIYEVNEAMTTNESSFFRDNKPYDYLRKQLIPLFKDKLALSKSMRIWSAACSTGQEPYTISMCFREEAALMPNWRIEILGTDLARKVVERAREGIYSQFEAQRGLPIQLLIKYFNQTPEGNWQLKPEIRQAITFRELNLLEAFTTLGAFDLIFCRNVLIYFDEPTKADILRRMAKQLPEHGVLILGSTESVPSEVKELVAVPDFRGAYALRK